MYNPLKPYKQSILGLIQKTWETPYVSIIHGAYPIIQKKFSYPEVDHTDGIGTKGLYHWQKRTFRNAVLDALAMNLNDLALARATPYKLQNHIFIPEDDAEALQNIVETLVQECRARDIAITGGETSIHNNIEGLDISITMSGFIENPQPNVFKIGDSVFGLKSSGLHSNGFTKVREVYGKEYREEFVEATKIYITEVSQLSKVVEIHGMMHITGGAFTKPKDFLQKDSDLLIQRNDVLKPQKIFYDLFERGVSDEEMSKTFNCGIGFIFSVAKADAHKIPSHIDAHQIGKVVLGTGKVKIESMFSNRLVEF